MAAASTVEAGTVEASPVEAAAAAQDSTSPADTTTATRMPGPGSLSAEAPAAPVTPAHPGSLPVIPAQIGVADTESGGGPGHEVPGEAAALHPEQREADQLYTDQRESEQPHPEQREADEAAPAQLAADQPGPTLQSSPASPETAPQETAPPETAPWETAPQAGMSEDGGPLRLVRIGTEADEEPWREDPWLPGSRRPDRRALIIGVVVIAGLLAVASTAWLVGVNPPQASSPHGAHLSRPSQLGSGHAQPSQALSGQPAPSLTQSSQPRPTQTAPTQPAPTRTGTGPARPSQTGHSQSGRGQSGSDHNKSGQSKPSQNKSGQRGSGQGRPGQSKPGQAGSGPSRTGQSGTGHGTSPTTPHPRRSAHASRGGRTARHSHPGTVSITRGLAGRADARRAAGLLVRYFAAVNHRRYRAYASLFAQRRQLTPRDFAWGYRTSHDSHAVLVGLAALKGGLKATVTFTSHQDPAQSPDHSSCIDWRITLFLHRAGATYLIGMPPRGYRPGLQACRFAPRHSSPGHSGQRTAKHSGSAHRSSQHLTSRHSARKHGHRKHH